MTAIRTKDPAVHRERLAARRRSRALQTLSTLPAEIDIEIPAVVREIKVRKQGVAPKLPVEAFELARQVYYLQHGTMADAARAIIAAGLGDSTDATIVRERLRTWWKREGWATRPLVQSMALRDAGADGGLFRGRLCKGVATGTGPAPAGAPCGQSALDDSDYCPHHDPRPEYVAMRSRNGERLAAARAVEEVPIEPFRRWLGELRDRLVAEEREAGRGLHHNSEGWHLVAELLELDISQLGRWAKGGKKRGEEITRIQSRSVARYAAAAGATFEEIYGFDQPKTGASYVCPSCSGRKDPHSQTCRACFEQEAYGTPCSYIDRKGRSCPQSTRHPSGVCGVHRKITERVLKPRLGKKSALTSEMLLFALDEYRAFPSLAWVGNHLWATDAGGVRSAYKSRSSLLSGLAKRFRKLGLKSPASIEAMYGELLAEFGPVVWPDPVEDLEDTALVPFAPFLAWVEARLDEIGRRRGAYKALGERTGLEADKISAWVRGVGVGNGKRTISREVVERSLERWGSGTFEDLYGGGK